MAIGREANVNSLHPSVSPSHETAGFVGGTGNPQSKICILAPKEFVTVVGIVGLDIVVEAH
jgi:hypothetical protein